MKLFGNHNKDFLKVIIHSTNQQLTLRKYDHLQDIGSTVMISKMICEYCISDQFKGEVTINPDDVPHILF